MKEQKIFSPTAHIMCGLKIDKSDISCEQKEGELKMRSIEDSMIISKYENLQECRKWASEIPALHFEKEWDVKIIPPFGGAVIRFCIDHNDKHVSVYFDGYSELGYVVDKNGKPIPYFECYDGEECYRYFTDESEQMMKDIKKFLES